MWAPFCDVYAPCNEEKGDGTMDFITDDIEQLVAKELASANEKFTLFHSSHEGYGVVAEEVEECIIELKNLLRYIDSLFLHVRLNDTGLQNLIIRDIRKSAINLACEAIQVAAMCDKWEMSFDKDREKEAEQKATGCNICNDTTNDRYYRNQHYKYCPHCGEKINLEVSK